MLIRRFDGDYHCFFSRAIPIQNNKKVIERWFGTKTDITDRKKLEEHLSNERDFTNAIYESQSAQPTWYWSDLLFHDTRLIFRIES